VASLVTTVRQFAALVKLSHSLLARDILRPVNKHVFIHNLNPSRHRLTGFVSSSEFFYCISHWMYSEYILHCVHCIVVKRLQCLCLWLTKWC